jgi:hypothetical protein
MAGDFYCDERGLSMSVYVHYLTECRLVQYHFGNFFNSRGERRQNFWRRRCRGLFWGGRAFFYAPKKPKKSLGALS